MQPTAKPKNPNFSSGPCSKRPGYDVSALSLNTLGRSHRSALGKKALALACSETARILGLPEGYRVGVVPGSDTGAVEMAMWSLLGQRGVDVLVCESFGAGWATDVVKQRTKFPDWFPQYPGVDPKDVMSIAMHGDPEFTSGSFSTPDPPEQVIAFYQDAFKKAGLTVTVKKQKEVRNKVNVETTKLEAKDKTRKATVDADASDGKTMVGFTY